MEGSVAAGEGPGTARPEGQGHGQTPWTESEGGRGRQQSLCGQPHAEPAGRTLLHTCLGY